MIAKKPLGRISLLILLVIVAVVLKGSSQKTVNETVFQEAPNATAYWEVKNKDYYLGYLIEATLTVTTKSGVTLVWRSMPKAGDQLPISAVEHELEVISLIVTTERNDDVVVTKFIYELLYLSPIDLTYPIDSKNMPAYLPFFQRYQIIDSGKKVEEDDSIIAATSEINIIPRVTKDSSPYYKFFSLSPSSTSWSTQRTIGRVLVGLAILMAVIYLIRLIIKVLPKREVVENLPDPQELYELWRQKDDPEIFIQALKLYRNRAWGHRKPSTWLWSTIIIYSGMSLSHDQIQSDFERLIKEAKDELSS